MGSGQQVSVPGPHGVLQVELPSGAEPGKAVHMRLSPYPDMKITVPPDAEAGQTLFFENSEVPVSRIAVKVPKGLCPGDAFEVTPPSVMVLAPAGASAGDMVVFETKDRSFRARIPEKTQLGHFAVRLPQPTTSSSPTTRNMG